jgi:uncharacterized protein (DUF1330 family)
VSGACSRSAGRCDRACWLDVGIPVGQATSDGAVSLTLCVLLWARPGAEEGLIAYEDTVLRIASDHQGRVRQRVRSSGADGQPLEIQILEFPSADALDAFMTDKRRQALADERDRVISKTEVIEVEVAS